MPLQDSLGAAVLLHDFDYTGVCPIHRTQHSLAVHQQEAHLGAAFLFQNVHKAGVSAAGVFAELLHVYPEILGQRPPRLGITGVLFQLNSMDIMFRQTDFGSNLAWRNTIAVRP
jgi:hypothetical protein